MNSLSKLDNWDLGQCSYPETLIYQKKIFYILFKFSLKWHLADSEGAVILLEYGKSFISSYRKIKTHFFVQSNTYFFEEKRHCTAVK